MADVPTFELPESPDGESVRELLAAVRGALDEDERHVRLDLGGRPVDGVGVGTIFCLKREARARGARVELTSVADEARAILEVFRVEELVELEPARQASPGPLTLLGEGVLGLVESGAEVLALLAEATYWTLVAPFLGRGFRLRATGTHLARYGTDAVPIIGLISLLIGVVLTVNSAFQLLRYGALHMVPNLVSVGLTRELGPVITAVVVAGRTGSETAAELGTMVVGEEIDAFETMGLDPSRFLVAPRLVALVIAMPTLVLFADAIGMLGGYAVGVGSYGISPDVYTSATIQSIRARDVLTGVAKSVVFAVIICLIGCQSGLAVEGGAEGVGRATTRAVVASISCIILANTVFTLAFYW